MLLRSARFPALLLCPELEHTTLFTSVKACTCTSPTNAACVCASLSRRMKSPKDFLKNVTPAHAEKASLKRRKKQTTPLFPFRRRLIKTQKLAVQFLRAASSTEWETHAEHCGTVTATFGHGASRRNKELTLSCSATHLANPNKPAAVPSAGFHIARIKNPFALDCWWCSPRRLGFHRT